MDDSPEEFRWVSIDEGFPPVRRRIPWRRMLPAAAAGTLLFAAGLVAGLLLGGGRGREAPAPAPATPEPGPAPAAPDRGTAALRALEEARAFAREQPEDLKGQIERFLRVAKEWEGTAAAEKARREAAEAPARRRERMLEELVDLDLRASELEGREEFRRALAVYEEARARREDPSWAKALDSKIEALRRRIGDLYLSLKAAAERARAAGDEAELAKIRDRLGTWGVEDCARDFERSFAAPAPGGSASAEAAPPEVRAWRDQWGRAMALAAARDYDAASAELKKAGRALPSEELRAEAAGDLELVRRAAAVYDDMRQAVGRWPAGAGISLKTAEGRPVSGTVWRADRDRLEIQTGPGRETVFVELPEVAAASLAELARVRGMVPDARGLALFLLAEGGSPGVEEALPEKYRDLAGRGRPKSSPEGGLPRRDEGKARELYYAAEREYRDPASRGRAVEKFRLLLRDYADTGVVLGAVERIGRRAEARPERYFAAADLRAGGTFRMRIHPLRGPCWETLEETEFGRARENFVEIEFEVPGGGAWRCWFQAGGCCAETFASYYQASDLTTEDRARPGRTVAVEPGSLYALTLAVPPSVRKAHADHGKDGAEGPPLSWAWIEVPLPRYPGAGTKRVRLLTSHRGLHVARAFVSSARREPPGEEEVRDLETARAEDLGLPARFEPDLLGAWGFDEGGGRVLGDASGNGLWGEIFGDPKWVEGKSGGALAFDGKDDWGRIPDSPALRVEGDLTLAFWIRFEAEGRGPHGVVVKGEGDCGVWGEAGNRLVFRQAGAGRPALAVSSARGLKPGEWHHVAAVVRGGRGHLYVDGAEDGVGERWGRPAVSAGPLVLGRSGEGFFAGRLDRLEIHGRALTPEEIRARAGR